MVRLLFAILATIGLVVFVMVNTHHVSLSFIVGPPIQIRMIFLLVCTFTVGALTTLFLMMGLRLRAKRRTHPLIDRQEMLPAEVMEEKPL
jgi:uncharacterized integral membrane protein